MARYSRYAVVTLKFQNGELMPGYEAPALGLRIKQVLSAERVSSNTWLVEVLGWKEGD